MASAGVLAGVPTCDLPCGLDFGMVWRLSSKRELDSLLKELTQEFLLWLSGNEPD